MNRIAILAAAAALALPVAAQQKPAPAAGQVVTPKQPYSSTAAQLAFEKEKNAQLQAHVVQEQEQQQMKALQDQFAAAEKELQAFIAATRKANGWDASYVYDRVKDEWTHEAKPAAKAAEPKK